MNDGILTRGTGRKSIHLWKKYNVNTSTTYWWNTYNVVGTTTYKWNKWSTINPSYGCYLHEGGNTTTPLGPSNVLSTSYTYDGNKFTDAGTILGPPSIKYNGSGAYVNDSTYPWETFIVYKWIREENGYNWYTRSSSTYMSPRNMGNQTNYQLTSNIYSKGSTSYGQVTSTSSSAYPSNGASGSYWYESAGSATSYSKGSTSYGYVTSSSRSAYPDNSYSGDRWYVYDNAPTYSYSMGSYIEDVLSTDPNKYPANAKSGSYWYVYQGQL